MVRPYKTAKMRLVEQNHQNIPIEKLLVEAYRRYLNERGAAYALGITQQAFNAWKYRLGLEAEIEAIAKAARRQA